MYCLPDDCGKQFSGINVKTVKGKNDEKLGDAQRKYDFSNQYTWQMKYTFSPTTITNETFICLPSPEANVEF